MVQTVWWGHCDLLSCVESIFNKNGILERLYQKNNWKLKPGDMDVQWCGCSFSVYFEGFFPWAQTALNTEKGIGYFFYLLVGLGQLSFCFGSINLHTFFSGMLFRGCKGAGIQKTWTIFLRWRIITGSGAAVISKTPASCSLIFWMSKCWNSRLLHRYVCWSALRGWNSGLLGWFLTNGVDGFEENVSLES